MVSRVVSAGFFFPQERKKGNFSRSAKAMGYDPDDDDDDISSDSKRKVKDQELAKEFAKALEGPSMSRCFSYGVNVNASDRPSRALANSFANS